MKLTGEQRIGLTKDGAARGIDTDNSIFRIYGHINLLYESVEI